MTTKATWDDLVQVVRGLSSREIGSSSVRGVFAISSEDNLQALKICLENEPDTHLQLIDNEEPSTLSVGQTVKVEVAPRFGFGLLVPNIGALLKAQSAHIKQPANFLLLDDFVSKVDSVDDSHVLARYRAVISLIENTLKPAAAFLDADESSLIFIKDGKFEMPIDYNGEDLRDLPILAVQELISILPIDKHKDQCKSIMAEAVMDMTGHLPDHKRFQHLLMHADDLKKRYDQGYNLFASAFSYEKVRDQVESARIEYIGKIHKVFSDIQNQLLSIPVATIIIATQMKDATRVAVAGYEFWINTAVLLGCWVFSILMIFLLYNQVHTLDVVRTEIERQKRQIEKDYASVANSFIDTFSYLTRRARTQKLVLWTIDSFVVIGLALSHIVYLKMTPMAREWLVAWLPCLNQYL